jgi:signal transduction histidine kinase/CheY-like chemotaxis protein/HPt (histidine-containing phosphotransfer) domain-containing protein
VFRTAVFFALLCLGAHGLSGAATWEKAARGGELMVERIPPSSIGLFGGMHGIAADKSGRLFVFSDRLGVFDGSNWTLIEVPGGTIVRSVAFDDRGRIWVGAINELGYCEEDASGHLKFTSLRGKLPDAEREVQDVWSVCVVGANVYFVCSNRVLQWNGEQFKSWSFPTAGRLAAVAGSGEYFFTHPETGLYRLTPQGPELLIAANKLPPRSVYWIERQGDRFYGASRSGTFLLGDTQPLSEPALTELLRDGFVTGGKRLPSGEVAIATIKGLAIVSSDLRRLVRLVTSVDGLPSGDIRGLVLDETNHLWAALATQGVIRIDASPGATLFRPDRRTSSAEFVKRAVQVGDQILAVSDAGLVALSLRKPERVLQPYFSPESMVTNLLPTPDGVVLNSGSTLIRLGPDRQATKLLEGASIDFSDFAPSPQRPGDIVVLQGYQLSLLTREAAGYQLKLLHELNRPTEDMMIDHRGAVWIDSPQNVAFRYDFDDGSLSAVPVATEVRSQARGVKFAQTSTRAFIFCGNGVFEVEGRTQLTPLASLPEGSGIVRAVGSDRRAELFAVVERTGTDGQTVFSLCRLDLTRPGAAWDEVYIPELTRVGAVNSLIEDTVNHHLWLGTDGGLLRLDPAALRTPSPLAPLHLAVRGIPESGELPFRQHRIAAVAESPDFGRRRELLYQYRLGKADEGEPSWSTASPRPTFVFQNLSDGDYLLEVRALDTFGQITAPAVTRFTVLPPLWRSLPAFGAYGVALLAAFISVVRVRESRIRRRNAELEKAVDERTAELQKANAAKDEFLASISHEIRNPLNGVVGLAASIDRTALDRSTAAKFEHLSHCATHLSSLLEDILDFAQLERGAFSLTPKPCEIRPLLQSVVAISAVQSAKAGRRVDVQVSPQVPPVLLVDAARLRQLLLNLVINALKYGDRGEVDVTVWAKPQGPDTALVTFAVSDEGPGMPPEEVAKLFQQFTRGSAAKRSRESGSGIGLSICRAIAGKMGGRLWAESEVGHGSTFSFEVALPIAPAAEPAAEPPAPLAWDVLVVDDEDYNRVALASLLESLGLRITTAADGTAALAACAEKQFDLVLLDYDMPGLTGPQVARELRDRGDLRVVILGTTAFATLEKHALCRQAGMNAVITKPITVEKIRAAFAEAFSAQQASPPVEIAEPGPRSPEVALRHLAERKRTIYETEREDFLQAVERSAAGITQALAHSDAAAGTHHAHRLVGQLSYIGQPRAEALARRLEAACGTQQWTEAQQLWRDTQAELDQLRRDLGA